jgi:O-acetyl-ADP-ribose deacetylase (regulator of RNase III)
MRIVAVRGDIAKVDVDAVVNPADATPHEFGHKSGRPRKPRRLVERAGQEVESEAAARGPVQVGEAMLTTGGRLRCKYVIHAPMGERSEALDPEGVKKSTFAALHCAAVSGLRSVAIPALRSGVGVTRALVNALKDFDEESGLEEVFIVGGNGEIVSAIKREIGSGN